MYTPAPNNNIYYRGMQSALNIFPWQFDFPQSELRKPLLCEFNLAIEKNWISIVVSQTLALWPICDFLHLNDGTVDKLQSVCQRGTLSDFMHLLKEIVNFVHHIFLVPNQIPFLFQQTAKSPKIYNFQS